MSKSYPHALEAERAILGGVIIDNRRIPELLELLMPEHFYIEAHRKVWAAVIELSRSAQPVDLVILSAQLRGAGHLEQVGGIAWLAALPDQVPVTTNLTHYARLVREKAVARRLLELAGDIQERALEDQDPVMAQCDGALQALLAVRQSWAPSSVVTMPAALSQTLERLEELIKRRETITGLSTGLPEVDAMTAGLQAGDLIIIAARPSMGKSALAVNIGQTAALTGVPVGIVSLEMSAAQLSNRMLSTLARVNSGSLRSGVISDGEWDRIIQAATRLHDAPIYIDETPGVDLQHVRSFAQRLRVERGLGLLVVDYLQLMGGQRGRGHGGPQNREQEVAELSRGLKALARELQIPVIALSQLNRSLEARADKRPMMSDLRESGAIEQDADVIMFLYREAMYRRMPGEEPDEEMLRKAELNIAKQRNGPTGSVELVFLGEYSLFASPAWSR